VKKPVEKSGGDGFDFFLGLFTWLLPFLDTQNKQKQQNHTRAHKQAAVEASYHDKATIRGHYQHCYPGAFYWNGP
jgi:hypothetical protein